ncbi:MAG: KdsC family phosphatase [Planctomycetota bacterium]|jgi:3-deoxy-D-manno-octulosonate 8-phosphate phosphatase (KDO 8-P phosphatase)
MPTSPDPAPVQLLLLDVDGVLTDGSIFIDSRGHELKRFFVRDGSLIVAWKRAGFQVGVITGRPSQVTTRRLAEFGIDLVSQGPAAGKLEAYDQLRRRAGVSNDAEVAYMGDDLADLPVLDRVGYPLAPADACDEVRDAAAYVTELPGGRGAVRQAIEHLLKSKGLWAKVLAHYGR